MEKEYTALLDKIEDFDRYVREHFDPQKPETLHGGEDPKARATFKKYADDLYKLTQACGKFKTEEEIEVRNRALVQLQLIQITDNVRQTQFDDKVVPKKGTAERKEYEDKIAKRDEAMLKYNCAFAGVEAGVQNISQTVDLDLVTWVQTTDPKQLQESLDSTGVNKMMSMSPDSPLFGIKNKAFGKGGLSAFTYLIPRKDGKGYKIDKAKSGEKALNTLLSDSKMKAMISAYQKAEKSWLTSAMTPTQEIECRLRFVNAYSQELKLLYCAISSDASQSQVLRDTANKVFAKKGISELVKDFKTFQDPSNTKTNYILDGINEYDKKFRKNYGKVKDNIGGTLPKNEKLLEVHKFLLQNGDFGTGVTSDVTKTTKQVRPFIDNFMAMPEKDQMKALYLLENKLYKQNTPVTEEMMKDYEPNMKKITSVLKATNAKFWKRMNSSYIYWQKLKTCVDRVHDAEVPTKEKSKVDKALKVSKIVTKVGSIGTKVLPMTAPSIALSGVSAALGSAKAVKDMVKNAEYTSGAQKADSVLAEAGKLTKSAQFTTLGVIIQTKNFGYMKAFQGLAIATNAIMTGKSIANVVTSKKNVNKVADLGNDIKKLMNRKDLSKDQKDILNKLETNTRMLKVINKDKVKIATAETVKNATALASSTLMASGVGVAALIPQVVVGIGTKVAESKIRQHDTENVIDAKLYANDEDKKKKIENTKAIIVGRYARLPENLRDKYANQVNDVITSDKNISAQIRQEAVRQSGEVNLQATKNSYIHEISTDIYKLLKTGAEKTKAGKLTDLDKKFIQLANKFVEATGGKKIDVKKLNLDSPKEQKTKNEVVQNLTKNMTV